MGDGHIFTSGFSAARRLERAQVDPTFLAAIAALPIGVAILDAAGEVLAANAAWSDPRQAAFGGEPCAVSYNYVDWCRSLPNQLGAKTLADNVSRVLACAQKACDQNFLACEAGVGRSVRVRVNRLGSGKPARFFVSHELVDIPSEDIEARILTAQVEERERLAAELHDSVGQNLLCLGLGLTRLARASPLSSEYSSILADVTTSLQQAQAEIRTFSFLLRPPWLEERGAFVSAVRELVAGFARRSGLKASVDIRGFPCSLGSARELALFRILQEALVNVHRHARASNVEVELMRRGSRVILTVRDDGAGMQAEGKAPTAGVGISSMRQRLLRLGGELRIVSGLDGTVLVAKLAL